MMGRVVNEPDLRYTQTENGELAIANFRLAVNRKFVRRGDPEADFFSCTAFGRKAEFAEKYLFKGIKILVEGRMQNDNYKNRAGENVYGMRLMIEEISFAESKKALESGNDEREEPERETRASSNRNRSDRADNHLFIFSIISISSYNLLSQNPVFHHLFPCTGHQYPDYAPGFLPKFLWILSRQNLISVCHPMHLSWYCFCIFHLHVPCHSHGHPFLLLFHFWCFWKLNAGFLHGQNGFD